MATTKVQSELIVDDVALAGNPTTTTQSAGNNTARIATTAFVTTAVDNLIASAPGTMDTLNEIAAALGDDPSFTTTVNNAIALKAPLASPTFTGTATAPAVNISAGTPVLTLTDTSSSAVTTITLDGTTTTIDSNGTNGDIIFKGQDGSSEITALTLNMSEAGAATFNSTLNSRAITITDGTTNGASTIGSASDELLLDTNADTGLTIRSGASNTGVVSFASPSDHNIGQVYYDHNTNSMVIRTNDATALTINSSQNATFAGNIKTTGELEVASSQPRILLDRGDGSYSWNIYNGDGTGNFALSTFNIANNGGTAVLTLLDNGNATFAGNITAGNNGNINIPTASSGNANLSFDGTNFTIVSNSSSANLKLQTNSQDTITIAANGNLTHHRGDATFAGSVNILDGSTDFTMSGDSNNNTYFISNGEFRIRPAGTTTNKFVIGSNGDLTTAGDIYLTGGGTIEAPSSTGSENLLLNAAGSILLRIDSNGNSGDNQSFNIMKHTNTSVFSVGETGNTYVGGVMDYKEHQHDVGEGVGVGEFYTQVAGSSFTDQFRINFDNASWGGVTVDIRLNPNSSAGASIWVQYTIFSHAAHSSANISAKDISGEGTGYINWVQESAGNLKCQLKTQYTTDDASARITYQMNHRGSQSITLEEL